MNKRKSGEESFMLNEASLNLKLKDFWIWSASELIGNSMRGWLAEYIVALALGQEKNGTRTEWDDFDLQTEAGTKIEIKSSAFLQNWKQKKFSRPSFGIAETKAWDSNLNKHGEIKKRRSDIYIFCLFIHKDVESANPLDLNQWEFYLIPTNGLNMKFGNQKSLALSRVRECSDIYSFSDLKLALEKY